MAYNAAQRWTEEKLEQEIRAGTAKLRQPASPVLLERLRQGLLSSPRTPHAIIEMAREEFGAA